MASTKVASKATKTAKTSKKENAIEENVVEKEDKITCVKCGCSNKSNFYMSKDKFRTHFEKVVYCKDCIKEIYEYYLKRYSNNINLAIYYTCRKVDVPYIHSNFEGALANVRNPESKIKGEENIIQAYFKNFSFADTNGWGTSFDDSQGENMIEGLASYDEFTKVKRKVKDTKEIDTDKYEILEYDTDELQQIWGNFGNVDLSYLQSEYLDWEDKLHGITDKSTDIMVKQVCLQCLEIKRERESENNVDKKLATLQNLLKTSGLIEKQDETAVEKNVGMSIEDIEHRRPIKKADPDFCDVDSIGDIINGFAGAMCRALGKENEYTEKFDEIYGKYSIDIIDDLKHKLQEDSNGQSQDKDKEVDLDE